MRCSRSYEKIRSKAESAIVPPPEGVVLTLEKYSKKLVLRNLTGLYVLKHFGV